MPNLIQSLQTRDLGHLRIVAGLWGLELASAENEAALKELNAALLDPELVSEIADTLPDNAQAAIRELLEAGNQMPWAAFTRQFGEIREAGPGRRDREKMFLHPVSPAEALFYRGIMARAFFDTANGAQEFAYIPDDLAEIFRSNWKMGSKGRSIPPSQPRLSQRTEPPGRLATPKERLLPIPTTDLVLDDATTLLAALRVGIDPPDLNVPAAVVRDLLNTAGILSGGTANLEQAKTFLEMPRSQALNWLTKAWESSESFNELRQLPGLVCEGEWSNQPLSTRKFLFHLLESLPEGKWWSMAAFILDIKGKHPDFQRPVGDYDSWLIKRVADGIFLRGFGSWDEVDGALVRYILSGPMFWLGVVELATNEEGQPASAFRVNEKPGASPEKGKLAVASNGRIRIPRLVPRATRYLISRFCEWEAPSPDGYNYRISTGSLKKAGEQGLKVSQLLSLLAKNANSEIPPAFVKALKRWEANGTEARVEQQTILRVSRPEVLEELRKSKTGRFLGETLGPVTAIVKAGAQSKVLAALAEMGLLAEASTNGQENGGPSRNGTAVTGKI